MTPTPKPPLNALVEAAKDAVSSWSASSAVTQIDDRMDALWNAVRALEDKEVAGSVLVPRALIEEAIHWLEVCAADCDFDGAQESARTHSDLASRLSRAAAGEKP